MELNNPTKHLQNPFFFQSNKEPSRMEVGIIYNKETGENPFGGRFLDHPDPLCKLNLKETSDFVKSLPTARNSDSKLFMDSPNQYKYNKGRDGNFMNQRRLSQDTTTPLTPARPSSVFITSSNATTTTGPSNFIGSPLVNLSRKPFPSKWDDAEKWVISPESPAHLFIKPTTTADIPKKQNHALNNYKMEAFGSEKFRVTTSSDAKVSAAVVVPTSSTHQLLGYFHSDTKSTFHDKFADSVEHVMPDMRYSEAVKGGVLLKTNSPLKEGLIKGGGCGGGGGEVVREVHHRDVGTEMTPIGSSLNSRCPTPIKLSSPPRHNTPAACSGPLDGSSPAGSAIDIAEIKDCHFHCYEVGNHEFNGGVDLRVSNWSTREEEEEEVSKSLRHFDMGNGRKSCVVESRNAAAAASASASASAAVWEDEERTKCCLRYQREEAKIQAWVNLQNAKAEAQSRKLEVKIERMRSNLAEKLMRRMTVAHRKAEEWRAAAQYQHQQHMLKSSSSSSSSLQLQLQQHHHHQTRRIMKTQNSCLSEAQSPCGCFPYSQ